MRLSKTRASGEYQGVVPQKIGGLRPICAASMHAFEADVQRVSYALCVRRAHK
jgi:hypothetical protein